MHQKHISTTERYGQPTPIESPEFGKAECGNAHPHLFRLVTAVTRTQRACSYPDLASELFRKRAENERELTKCLENHCLRQQRRRLSLYYRLGLHLSRRK